MTLLIIMSEQLDCIPPSISIKQHHSVKVLADMVPLPASSLTSLHFDPSLLPQTDWELRALQMCPDSNGPKKGRQERRTAGMWKKRQEREGAALVIYDFS